VPLLAFVFIYEVLYMVLKSYLPQSSVEYIPAIKSEMDFNKYNFNRTYHVKKIVRKQKAKVKKQKPKKKVYNLIQSVSLKAIYAGKNALGWILISDKNNKTSILQVNDKYQDYKLHAVYRGYAIFTKDGREYKLMMNKQNDTKAQKLYDKYSDNKTKTKAIQKPIDEPVVEVIDDNFMQVKRDDIMSYSKDFKKIWRNIAITENMRNGKIDGFKVQRINKKSVFAKLGLQKNDIIKKINNTKLKSYADAFKVYNKINTIDFIQITVLRNGQIMELEYDIK
jgi:general secretion pathway protein C